MTAEKPLIPIAPSRPPIPKVRHWQYAGMAGGVALFLLLALDGVLQGPVYQFDSVVNGWVTSGVERGFPLHTIGEYGSYPGDYLVAGTAVVICAGLWWYWKERRIAVWALLGGLTASVTVTLLKIAFQRERPPFEDVPHSFSFPSGHTMGATATLGILIILATQVHVDRQKLHGVRADKAWARAIAAWIGASLVVGLCRILAQDHWLSDVLASMALGLAVVCAVVRVAGIPRPRFKPPT